MGEITTGFQRHTMGQEAGKDKSFNKLERGNAFSYDEINVREYGPERLIYATRTESSSRS